LAQNHPNNYPDYISAENFADYYNIKQVIFNFYLNEITEEQDPPNYFKLRVNQNNSYYFQTNEKLERMLSAVTEDHITKFTYLNNLFDENPDETFELTLESAVDAILDEICGIIFDENLRDSLKEFVPQYINYLAYKIEKERKLVDVYDKLKGLIFQEILSYTEEEKSLIDFNSYEKSIKKINIAINRNPEELSLYQSKEHILLYFNRYDELLEFLEEMLILFPKEEKDILIKKAYILKEKRELEEGLSIIDELIEDFPDDNNLLNYKVYWLQYLNRKKSAVELIKQIIGKEPDNGIYHDTYGEILMAFQDYNNAIAEFLKTIELSKKEWFIYQTYIKLGICYKELGKFSLAIEKINSGLSFAGKSKGDDETRNNWMAIATLFLAEIKELKSND
jgi:tetratricopeptide (TPR) repeat protein